MLTKTSVVVATLALGAAVAPATASREKSHAQTIVIKARSQLDHAQFVDNGAPGSSPGDVLLFTEKLLNSKGRSIGSDAATCTSLFDARSLCTGAYTLKGGQVLVQLVQPGPTGIYNQAITGGTGRFARANGTVTVDQSPGGDRFTFRIHIPGS
jgi:hypothetical protein